MIRRIEHTILIISAEESGAANDDPGVRQNYISQHLAELTFPVLALRGDQMRHKANLFNKLICSQQRKQCKFYAIFA